MNRSTASGGRAAVLLCLLVSLTGCGPTDHVARGDALFDQQQYTAAMASYERALEEEPDNPQALRGLGLSYVRTGEAAKAYPHLEKAQALQPNDTELAVLLGRVYVEDGRLEEAKRQADTVLERDPDHVEALNLLGATHMMAGRHGPARDAFERMAELSPQDARARYLVGMALEAEGRHADARSAYEASLALAPSSIAPLVQIVGIARAEQRLDVGIERVREQIASVSEPAPLYTLLGTLHAERGERGPAEEAFLSALEADPRFTEGHIRLSELYRNDGEYDRALAAASDAVRSEPGNPEGLLHLGYIYQEKGDLERAERSYEEVLEMNPRSAAAANNLAWLLSEREADDERALELAQRAHELLPEDPNIMDTLGWVHFRSGRFEEAVRLLSEAAARRPGHGGVQYRLGMAHAEAGDTAAARQALTLAANASGASEEKEAARAALARLR